MFYIFTSGSNIQYCARGFAYNKRNIKDLRFRFGMRMSIVWFQCSESSIIVLFLEVQLFVWIPLSFLL